MRLRFYWRELIRYPIALALLLFGCVGICYVGGSFYVQANLPSDGVLLTEFFSPDLTVVTRLTADRDDLRLGDEILAVDGRSIEAWAARSLRGGPAPRWEVGQTILYRVRRAGRVVEVPVDLIPFPIARLPLVRFGVYVLTLVQLLIGVYVLLNRPDDDATRLLFIIAFCLLFVLLLHVQVMSLVTPTLFVLENGLKFLGRAVLFSAILHLCLVFPVRKLGAAAGLSWLHIVNPVLSLGFGWLLGQTLLERFTLTLMISSWIGLLMMLAGVLSILHTYFTVRRAAVRAQIRWVVWGCLLGLLPYLVFTGLPELITGQPVLTIELTAFFVVVAPVAVAIAVARYRLFDIDVLIWRTLFYVLLVLLMMGLYFLLQGGVSRALSWVVGLPAPRLTVFVTTLVVASIFWVLHRPVMGRIDRLLYRSVNNPQQLLNRMTERLTTTIQLGQLASLLEQELPRQLGASQGRLMVLNEAGDSLELLGDACVSLPLEGMLNLWIAQGGDPILRSASQPWVPSPGLDLMQDYDIELIVPLKIGERIVGIWGLGARTGSLPYTTADVRLVVRLARQVALAVQNARLVRRLERQREQLEEEVHRRTQAMTSDRNRLNAILQNMADALLVTDANRRIQLTNPAFERLVRRSTRALVGRKLDQVLPQPELSEAIDTALARPGEFLVIKLSWVDSRLNDDNGVALTERILRASISALGDGNAVICILQDITHQVEIERMKSEFVSAVSHELRTPLTSILGFAKLTYRTFERAILPQLPEREKVRRAAERIHRNLDIMVMEGDRLTTLINDVLDIAALDAGTIQWKDQPYELPALIQRVIDRLREEAESEGLRVGAEIADRLPLLKGDPERIDQVLANLVTNAIKFTDQGAVTVSAKPLAARETVHNWQAPPEGAVLVAVHDTGRGIAPDELPEIFERFSQGGDAMIEKPHGTGLGLAICKEIVSHYAGTIWAESELGVGSSFYFTLPSMASQNQDVDAAHS